MIESNSNQQIKYIQKLLKTSRFRRKEKAFVVEGWKMVEEAYKRKLIQALYVSSQAMEEASQRFDDDSLRIEEVSDSIFKEITDTVTPQGVVAVVNMPQYKLEDFLTEEKLAFICLEDLNDPGNLGTIMRTAEGAGMTGVLMSKGTVDLFNPKVVRSTMGSLFRMPFFYVENFCETLQSLKHEKVTLYAAHLKGETYYSDCDYSGKVGILIGNEANGLSDQATELCDVPVKIPMEGQLESLNAAVSAALFMYEVARKRR